VGRVPTTGTNVAAADPVIDSVPQSLRRFYKQPGWDVVPGDLVGEEGPATILILESREITRFMFRNMLKGEGYRILEATGAQEALDLLSRARVDLIVLDLVMPEVSGLEFCAAVKANYHTRFIPVVMVTSVQGAENEVASIGAGADAFLTLPLHPAIVRARIHAMLQQKRVLDSLEEGESLLFALAQAVEHRDRCTAGHCERLSLMSVNLGAALGLSHSEVVTLHRGGYMHDIGKIAVPDAILFKPGPLTPEEWVVMRSHVTKGVEICSPARTLAPVLPIIRSHHERWDGSGYPDGLRGEEIPLLARILQVADVYDALTSARPYKPAYPQEEALRILDEEVSRGWRDPALVQLLHELCESRIPGAANRTLLPCPAPETFERSLDNMRRMLLKDRAVTNARVE
jgi:putative two-component system response regulator